MTNLNREVKLMDLNRDDVAILSYKYPVGQKIHEEYGVEVPGYPAAKIDIEIWRAEEELSQGEAGYIRDGGLLVRSGNAIHCATLFKFDSDKYARRLYGSLHCEYLHELIGKEAPVISDKRDGLETEHPFVRALKQLTEEILEPIVTKERMAEDAERKQLETTKTLARFQNTVHELNRIAKLELSTIEGPVQIEQTTQVPPTIITPAINFQFSTGYAQIVTGKREALYLKTAVPGFLSHGTKVTIQSNSEEVTVLSKEIILDQDRAVDGIVTSKIIVEGRQVGAITTVTATATGQETKMLVKVISERIRCPPPHPPPLKAGLFREIRFNDVDGPTQRAFYNENTGVIEIYTKSESVAMYLGPHGENQEKPYCQVLVAELITDIYCRFLAKQLEKKGMLLIVSEATRLDAIDRAHENLRCKYAAVIHKCLVDASVHRETVITQHTEIATHEERTI